MKIVLISRITYPLQSPRAFRTAELSEQFAKMGHDVTVYAVLGSKTNYNEYQQNSGVKVKPIITKLSKSNSDNDKRWNLIDRFLIKTFHRIAEYPDVEFLFKINDVLKREKDVDLLISIAYPHPIHWGCALAKKILKDKFPKCWIADCGDPYYFDPYHPKPFYFKWIEKWWCKNADYITIPVEKGKNAYFSEVRNKIHVIPQGFNFSKTPIAEYKKNKVPTFGFAGAIYPGKRDLNSFIAYLAKQNFDFCFIIYSRYDVLKNVDEDVKKKIVLYRDKGRKDIIYEFSKIDFLINIKNISSVQSPSKLIDYALTKRPILDISNDFLSEDEINFKKFLDGDFSSQHQISNIEDFNIINVSNAFINLKENFYQV